MVKNLAATDDVEDVATKGYVDTGLSGKSGTSHNHDAAYASSGHGHNDVYYTESEVDSLLAGKSSTSHDHNSTYYTETEVNNLLAGKADTHSHPYASDTHTHDGRYYTESEVDSLLAGKSSTSHGHAQDPPLADGAPPNPVFGTGSAVGTSGEAAREDHVHALGTPATPPSTTASSGTVGTSTIPARSNHRHGFATAVGSTQAFGDAASAGTASSISRSDHKHAMPTNPVPAHESAADPHPVYATDDDLQSLSLMLMGA